MKMPKTYTVSAENRVELRDAMKKKTNSRFYARLQAVALRGEGKGNEEIGEITGFHPVYVSKPVSIFINGGIAALCQDRRKGGNSRNLTDAEEKAFLAGFEQAAKSGKLTTVDEIADAYDALVGKEHESKSTVYYLLHKYGWRMITPQTIHPGKASDEVIEASKKLTI